MRFVARIRHRLVGNLRRQLTLGMVLVMAAAMSAFVWDLTRRQQDELVQQQHQQAQAMARSMATSVSVAVGTQDVEGAQDIVEGFSGYPDLRYMMVLDLHGQVLAHTDASRRGQFLEDLPPVPELRVQQQGSAVVDVLTPVRLGDQHIGWARVGLDRHTLDHELSHMARHGVEGVLIAIVLGAAIAQWAGRYMTRRLHEIQRVADAVQAGHTEQRAEVPGDDEAARLARHVNSMLDTLVQRKVALKDALAQLQLLTNRVPGVVVFQFRRHPDGRTQVPYASEVLHDIYRIRPEALREDASALFAATHPDDQPGFLAAMTASAQRLVPWIHEWRLQFAGEPEVWLMVNAMPQPERDGATLWYGYITDISERKRAENALRESEARLSTAVQQLGHNNAELKSLNARLAQSQVQLLRSEKMAAVGQLAAGMAHEINNPVGFITSNLGTLQRYAHSLLAVVDAQQRCMATGTPQDSEALRLALQDADLDYLRGDVAALLSESREGLERVRKIVQHLRDFSRIDSADWQEADLLAGLESTLNVMGNELKYKADVVNQCGELPLVYCHLGQINQVFLNLLLNACDAMDSRGSIRLSCGTEGAWVWVGIEDSGRGMAPELMNRIFEPFFSTKPVGRGTGLGLSLAYDIVSHHGGRIEVNSVLGQGARFTVWLPIAGPQDAPVGGPG